MRLSRCSVVVLLAVTAVGPLTAAAARAQGSDAGRVVCTAGDRVVDYTCPGRGVVVVASEDDPPGPGADPDVAAAYTNVGGVEDFYRNVLGRDGIDGRGGVVDATVHVCEYVKQCPMMDAFWDGRALAFGTGFPEARDVVAHEMTHGVTAATSDLFYLYQSGAINESMSDVLGELYDQWAEAGQGGAGSAGGVDRRWMVGEQLPRSVGVLRDLRDPTKAPAGVPAPHFTRQPDSMTSPLYRADADPRTGAPVDYGGVHLNSGVGNKAAELIVDGGRLNGVTVTGLGGADPDTRTAAVVKAAHLYYLVDRSLPSGADYADLAAMLVRSCAQLVGRPLADGRGGTVVLSSTDCDSVREAVAATRMMTDPRHAAAPDAPTCNASTPQSFGFRDDFEDVADRRWTTGAGWYDPQTRSADGPSYATSGHHELYAADGDRARDGSATMRGSYSVPVGKASYLRFAQAYVLDYLPAGQGLPAVYFDGGRVEYSRNGGPWTSAGPLFDFGGYPAKVTGYDRGKRAYAFYGFAGDSHGYRSSRLSLSSLAGSSVRFRFRMTTDAAGSSYGWFIDDVAFYACGAKPSAVKASVVRGATTVRLAWSAPSDHGTSPITSYAVSVLDTTAGRTVAATSVAAGVRSIAIVALRGHHYRYTVAAYNKSGRGASGAVTA